MTDDFSSFPTIDHVYRAAEELQSQQVNTRSMRNLGKIRTFLESLRHFGEVIDTFVQVKPDVLALIWGPIKLLLVVSCNFYSIHDNVLSAMELIGDALPAFKQYTQLFPNNTKMHQALCLFYTDIMDFYATLLDLFKHNKWSAIFRSLWPRCLGRLQTITQNILSHRSLLSDEATLANMVQAQKDRETALKAYENQCEFQTRQDFEAAMSSLNPRLYDQDLERRKTQMNPNSGNWIFDNPKFKTWLDLADRQSRVLWIQGIPGARKTYLSSSVTSELAGEDRREAAVFLSYRFSQECTALKVLHSLIVQFILDETKLRQLLIAAHNDNYRKLKSSLDFVKDLLKEILDCLPSSFIVVDGVDEIEEDERRSLLKTMLALSKETQGLGVLISSRPEDDITRLVG
ncbi:hypothetical protein CGMCC3_g431 [Colletotrichum fructicola]|uniref:Nacht domain protein n=1 Tax=Colletotrichum fructicola (strain Nara gc5) TaxID=1213859 RepID=L2FES8_COLFN|nr:uncharacterized protein CGMCC3_g431 [Colletotrichum fructicola]KAE9583427.1 hypothetical protein CGMCC3_g431 [Colletotrichum fructicola]KAF4487468.1 hypothetical protein CGGC5_v005043 [Colletotrichum fructicola Nara gc5]KAF4883241.1 hypothetical protein CGCFRS4_v013749 [Colletotrichum fructicola]